MFTVADFPDDIPTRRSAVKRIAGMFAPLPSLNHSIVSHDCHFHKSRRPAVNLYPRVLTNTTAGFQRIETDAVLWYRIAENQSRLVTALPSNDHVVTPHRHRLVQIIRPFT
jgi:hypothetical protein